MRRRRKGSGGTWFPVLGTTPDTDESFAQITLALGIPNGLTNVKAVTGIVPLTFDTPQEGANTDPITDTLTELVGNEYFLKRIVGNVFVSVHQDIDDPTIAGATDFEPAYIVTAGFFVARAGDENTGEDLPIGANSATTVAHSYRVDAQETIREPWIWRRSWLLGNPARAFMIQQLGTTGPGSIQLGTAELPSSNIFYGTLGGGPHLDAKTRRRVRQDDRLWFAISARPYRTSEAVAPGSPDGEIRVVLDYRIFASLRKAKNSGNF